MQYRKTHLVLLFIVGFFGCDSDSDEVVGIGDVAAQTKQVFENIGTILNSADADFRNVVQFTTYVVGRQSVNSFLESREQVFF